MATWHQEQARKRAGGTGLWYPHPTEWKCVSDKPGQFASSMSFTDEAKARAYCEKTGDALIPPENYRG